MGTCVAMQNTSLHSFVNLAECRIHTRLNTGFCLIARGSGVGLTGTQTALHQSAQGRFVGLVLEAIALSDLDALF